MELKDLQLTEADFKLLIDGLDALPNRSKLGEFAGEVLSAILPPHLKEHPRFIEQERNYQQELRQKEKEREALIEDIKILQGKLLMFKRLCIEQDALKQTNDILNKK